MKWSQTDQDHLRLAQGDADVERAAQLSWSSAVSDSATKFQEFETFVLPLDVFFPLGENVACTYCVTRAIL